MTSNGQGDEPLSIDSAPAPIITEDGPYVLRSLLDEVPLSGDGSEEDIKINCVDYLGESLPHFSLLPELVLIAHVKITTYTSAPPHPNSFTSSKYPPILPISLVSQFTS